MAFIENEPGVEILLGMTLERYRGTQTFAKILEQMGEEADLLQDVNRELYDLLDPDALSGSSLEMLGRVVGCSRNGASDAVYRIRIKAELGLSISGTPEQIMTAVRGALGLSGPGTVMYIPEYPAAYWVVPASGGVSADFLDTISPGGVRGFPGAFLALTTGELVKTTEDENILVVGRGVGEAVYPADNIWDGGMGAIDPSAMVFDEPWPFRDSNGIGEYPDGGIGAIDPDLHTFTDGSYADDLGG